MVPSMETLADFIVIRCLVWHSGNLDCELPGNTYRLCDACLTPHWKPIRLLSSILAHSSTVAIWPWGQPLAQYYEQ